MIDKKTLWLNLKNYHFDHLVPQNLWYKLSEIFGDEHASTKAFADKIARKLKWNKHFALHAIGEYKKFVYLGVISDFHVTPSKIIDQVWHEHLLFTKAYREFCTNIIEYNFDHNPELIPVSEQTGVFNAQYLETLELYRKEFGIEPPSYVWSVPKFAETLVAVNGYKSKKKETIYGGDYSSSGGGDTTLVAMFESDYQENNDAFPEFGGGDFGGGGAGDSWDSDSSSDSSDSSSDGGSSCSSCSSGCGGGGD